MKRIRGIDLFSLQIYRIVSDNTPLTLVKGDCTSSCEIISILIHFYCLVNFSQATTLKYIHIISGARNVELYVKQSNLAQTNYVTTIRGNRLDPENNGINRVFVSDFVNKTNPRIKYDVLKLKMLSLIDKTKCVVNGIFIGVYENPPINSPLIGTNPSESQRASSSSFMQHSPQYQSQQQQQQQQPQQNYNLINTYQVQFMLAAEVKKMEARLITRLDRTCLSIVDNFNKKISSMEERLGMMEDAIEEIVNRIVPENSEANEGEVVEQQQQQQQQFEEKLQQQEQNEVVEEPPPPPPVLPSEEEHLPEVQQEEQSHEEEKQNLEEERENVQQQQEQSQSETQNEELNEGINENTEVVENQQPINNDCNIEPANTESEPQTESKKAEESDEHSQQTTETECSECD